MLSEVGVDGGAHGGMEAGRAEALEQLEALQLVLDRILHLGEPQLDARIPQGLLELGEQRSSFPALEIQRENPRELPSRWELDLGRAPQPRPGRRGVSARLRRWAQRPPVATLTPTGARSGPCR